MIPHYIVVRSSRRTNSRQVLALCSMSNAAIMRRYNKSILGSCCGRWCYVSLSFASTKDDDDDDEPFFFEPFFFPFVLKKAPILPFFFEPFFFRLSVVSCGVNVVEIFFCCASSSCC